MVKFTLIVCKLKHFPETNLVFWAKPTLPSFKSSILSVFEERLNIIFSVFYYLNLQIF